MATSSNRFFGSPTATLLCPDSDPPPAFAASCSHRAAASLPVPGSHPSHRTSPSRRKACAWTPPPLAPHLLLFALPPPASTPRSSALPCACSSTYLLPLPFAEIILSFVRKQGIRSLALPRSYSTAENSEPPLSISGLGSKLGHS